MKGRSKNSPPPRTSLASPRADLRELRTNSGATVEELQDFLRELRGRSPQEMLGVVASSRLFQSIILSAILVAALLFILTAIPYFLGDEPVPEETTETPAAPPSPAPPAPAPVPEPDLDQTPESLAPLGVNEQKTAPPGTNPLEDEGSSFLDDLE